VPKMCMYSHICSYDAAHKATGTQTKSIILVLLSLNMVTTTQSDGTLSKLPYMQ